jgi:ABC-type multidrug transport system ATPase subunit
VVCHSGYATNDQQYAYVLSLFVLLPCPPRQVYTPTGELLVKDLSFEIRRGTNLLLTGCNGSGKSSLFRCLGGLWQLRGGTITKPGGSNRGLNKKVSSSMRVYVCPCVR